MQFTCEQFNHHFFDSALQRELLESGLLVVPRRKAAAGFQGIATQVGQNFGARAFGIARDII